MGKPGRDEPFLVHPPKTVRATFIAYGSSLHETKKLGRQRTNVSRDYTTYNKLLWSSSTCLSGLWASAWPLG